MEPTVQHGEGTILWQQLNYGCDKALHINTNTNGMHHALLLGFQAESPYESRKVPFKIEDHATT